MTTPNNQPTPPPGMEILADYTKPLPSGAMIQMSDGWAPSDVILGSRPHPAFIYAIPITVPATGDESICPDCKSKMNLVCNPAGSNEYYVCFSCENKSGDTTNEKGGELCAENTKIVSDAEDQSALNVNALVDKSYPASNAALDVRPVEQRQELLPCPFCKTSDIWSGWNGSSAPGTEDCGYWSTGCAACGIEFHADEQEEAEKKWNTRK